MMDSQGSAPHSAQSSRDRPERTGRLPRRLTAFPPEPAGDTARLPDRRQLTHVALQSCKSILSRDVARQ